MEELKIEISDLTPEDKWIALTTLLINKDVISHYELMEYLQENADMQNEALQERIKDNPALKRKVQRFLKDRRMERQS